MAKSKRTKKFEKKHLDDTLRRRKEFAKVKQKKQAVANKKARRSEENGPSKTNENGTGGVGSSPAGDKLGETSVDEFFSGGFDVLAEPKSNKQKTLTSVTGKRKRDTTAANGSDGKFDLNGTAKDSDSESSAEDHKQQLEELAEKDPEFYEYLKENDAELLDFEGADGTLRIDELSGDEDNDAEGLPGKDSQSDFKNELTMSTVKKWHSAMAEKHSIRSAKELVLAFRAAAHTDDEADSRHKYSLTDPEVYHEVVVSALRDIPEVIQHHVPLKEGKGGKVRLDMQSQSFRSLTPLLKSHAISINRLLETLSDEGTIRQTLSSILSLVPYLLSFRKLLRNLVKTVADIWSTASNKEASRIAAFLVMRKLAVIGDAGIKETVFKVTYQGFVKGCRNTTIHTIQGINLMKNSAAELWVLDPAMGYTTGYSFIRQLGIHLRASITKNSNESFKLIYNWQYVHSLDFWSRVISLSCDSLLEATAGKESPLRPLIYPLVQVTLGAMRLIPTSTYYPLRFHLIRALLRISSTTSTYIPLASVLYEVLGAAEMKKRPKQSTLKALDFNIAIKAPKPYLRTRVYQDGVGEQVSELLSEFFVLWTKNIAFPELALPVTVLFKRWLKETGNKMRGNANNRLNSMLALVVQKLESNSRWIEERRAKVEFAPNNRAGVEAFLKDLEWEKTPLGAFVVGQRKMREEKAKLIEEGRREEERKREEEQEDDSMEDFSEEEVDGVESGEDEDEDEDEDEMSE
ncbi:MAG: Nucleolar Complex 2 protein [Bathelium mastoideum]|nr:MAG: Nucleolar Complex 2 protein [Bathelium mastoideum]KAI9692158.1 MAG: Nucleolar Complex 2 protein [Bathelium mastoideum]